jgi:glycosyltransferase involved in cell wall biosynthesis
VEDYGQPAAAPAAVSAGGSTLMTKLFAGNRILTNTHLKACVPFWELPDLPQSWIPKLERMDVILAPTHFIEQTIGSRVSGPAIRHYPQTVFLPSEVKADRARWDIPGGTIAFVSSFEIVSDVKRKNPAAIIEAFSRAFAGDKRAMLILKINNPSIVESFATAVKQLKRSVEGNPAIRIIDQSMPYTDVLSLYASCDVLVSLHRAEGLGFCLMEAMSLGKPVIATGWSGNMDFTDDSNSCLVGYKLIPSDLTASWANRSDYAMANAVWAEPSVDEAARWMVRLADDSDLRRAIGEKAADDMHKRHVRCLEGRTFKSLEELYHTRQIFKSIH